MELQLNETSYLETSADLEAIANEFLAEQQLTEQQAWLGLGLGLGLGSGLGLVRP